MAVISCQILNSGSAQNSTRTALRKRGLGSAAYGGDEIGLLVAVASKTTSRVCPLGNRTPGTISGCVSVLRRSQGICCGKNSRLIPRLRTAAAVSRLSSKVAPSRELL